MTDITSLSTENIKKIVEKQREAKKANLSKGLKIPIPKNPLDKFTSIDELLRENITAQRDLFDEQRTTNKLLLALYYKDGAGVSIQPNGVDTTAILEGLRGGDDYRTLNKIIHNETGDKTILEVVGSGIIDVIKFVSPTTTVDNKDYSVRIRSDTTILYANTWTELEARTPNERGMVCFEDEDSNEYLLMFKTIAYSEKFTIEVYDSNATLSMVQVKYHERV